MIDAEAIADDLQPSLRELIMSADASTGIMRGNRGGAGYRALARRGLSWPRANYLLTPDGQKVAVVLRRRAAVAALFRWDDGPARSILEYDGEPVGRVTHRDGEGWYLSDGPHGPLIGQPFSGEGCRDRAKAALLEAAVAEKSREPAGEPVQLPGCIYACNTCRVSGVRLWRGYFASLPLWCRSCAEASEGSRKREDQTIGLLVPAIPDPTGVMHAAPASAEDRVRWVRLPESAEPTARIAADALRIRQLEAALEAALEYEGDRVDCSCCRKCGAKVPCQSSLLGEYCDGACFCGVEDGEDT